jgi:tetratricopeptide (TPR) repeat protein
MLAPACASNDPTALSAQALATAHARWAGVLISLGQPRAGLRHAERGVELHLGSAAAHYTLARACELSGDTERAIVELEVTLRLAPEHSEAHRKLAHAYLATGRPRAAREHARRVLAHAPNDPGD